MIPAAPGASDRRGAIAATLPPVLLVAAAIGWVLAFCLPFLRAEFQLAFPWWVPSTLEDDLRAWLIAAGRMPVGDQYLGTVIRRLIMSEDFMIGAALLAFSVIFPMAKLVLCGLIVFAARSLGPTRLVRLGELLLTTGKWAMADVFVVALVVVMFKAEGFQYAFRAGPGVYCYAATALLTSAAAALARPAKRT